MKLGVINRIILLIIKTINCLNIKTLKKLIDIMFKNPLLIIKVYLIILIAKSKECIQIHILDRINNKRFHKVCQILVFLIYQEMIQLEQFNLVKWSKIQ